MVRLWLRFHTPLIEPDKQISCIRLVWGFSLSRRHHAISVVLCHSILLFDPRRKHSFVPTAYLHRRRAQRRSRTALAGGTYLVETHEPRIASDIGCVDDDLSEINTRRRARAFSAVRPQWSGLHNSVTCGTTFSKSRASNESPRRGHLDSDPNLPQRGLGALDRLWLALAVSPIAGHRKRPSRPR